MPFSHLKGLIDNLKMNLQTHLTLLFKLFLLVILSTTKINAADTWVTNTSHAGCSTDNWNDSDCWLKNGAHPGTDRPDIDQFPNDLITVVHDITVFGNLIANSSAGDKDMVTVQSGATLTITGSLTASNGDIEVLAGGTIAVGGSVTMAQSRGTLNVAGTITCVNYNMSGGGDLNITSTGTLTCSGNVVTTGNGSKLNIDGTFNVGGTANVLGDAKWNVLGNGTLDVDGTLNVVGSGGVNVDGDLDVSDGHILIRNDGRIVGTGGGGTVSWGTKSLNPSCSGWGFISCDNGNRYDDNTCNDPGRPVPPANPLDLGTCGAAVVCGTVGGTVNSAVNVCEGTNGATLTLSGHTGSILRWESSTDNFANTTVIANTTTTQTYNNLTTTTKYRAVVKDGTCPEANSTEVEITIDPLTVGGTINSAGNSLLRD